MSFLLPEAGVSHSLSPPGPMDARSDVTFWLAWVQAGLSPRWPSTIQCAQAASHPWGFGLEILGPKVTDEVAVGFEDVVDGTRLGAGPCPSASCGHPHRAGRAG